MNISKHLTYREATKSRTAITHGINNDPDEYQLLNMLSLAQNIFEPVREHFKVPIAVTSFFRSDALNKRIRGASGSQHTKGEAMDLDADVYGDLTNKQIFNYIKDCLVFDQLIWEFGDDNEPAWVHVSFKKVGHNRGQMLKAFKDVNWAGKPVTKYIKI